MIYFTECPECGREAKESGTWAKPGFSGFFITGLDAEHCPGCWDTMQRNGAAPGILNTVDGSFRPVPRPTPEKEPAV